MLGRHNCIKPYECRNTKGSFRCDKPRVATTTTTTTTSTTTTTTKRPQTYTPSVVYTQAYRYTAWPTALPNRVNIEYDERYGPCQEGFYRNGQGACTDIDECVSNNPCRRNQRCINTNGSYKCQNLLQCSNGYTSNDAGTQCIGNLLNEIDLFWRIYLICSYSLDSFSCLPLPGDRSYCVKPLEPFTNTLI